MACQQGKQTIEGLARQFGVSRNTLHRWCAQARRKRGTQRFTSKSGRGRKRVIGREEAKKLLKIIGEPASCYGFPDDLWNCPRLVIILKRELGLKLSRVQVWQFLEDSGLRYIKPEKRYRAQNEGERSKWTSEDLPQIIEFARAKRAILYFEDESSLALQPSSGKTWAQHGTTPIIRVPEGRGSIPILSVISPSGKLLFSLPRTKIRSDTIISFLKQILRHHKNRHVVVIMDSAPAHTSKQTKAFINSQKRLHVFFLPPYSPDLNPDELVWNHLKHQKMKAHRAGSKQELRNLASKNLKAIQKKTPMLKAFCRKVYAPLFS